MLNKTCTFYNKTYYALKLEDFRKFFWYSKSGLNGYTSSCIDCNKKEKKKYYQKHPEKMPRTPRKEKKIKPCIVCGKEFEAREEKHICCSDECKKFKNKVRSKLGMSKQKEKNKKKRAKEIAKSKVRNKHYTDEEMKKIKIMLEKEYSAERIAKNLGRTTTGVQKKIRQIKKG